MQNQGCSTSHQHRAARIKGPVFTEISSRLLARAKAQNGRGNGSGEMASGVHSCRAGNMLKPNARK